MEEWNDEVRTWLYMLWIVAMIERWLEAYLGQYGLTPQQFEVLA